MRFLIGDTETTGFSTQDDRLIEIGLIETVNMIPTGKTLHLYFNPDRDIPMDAFRVHGITRAFLKSKPRFAALAGRLLDFIGDSPLVFHNAPFDMRFINAELRRCGQPEIPTTKDRVIDTVVLARKKFPGMSNSLDALCSRLGVSNTHRTRHGALLDAEILADVFLKLNGGRQQSLSLDGQAGTSIEAVVRQARESQRADYLEDPDEVPDDTVVENDVDNSEYQESVIPIPAPGRPRRPASHPSEEEIARHQAYLRAEVKDALFLKTVKTAAPIQPCAPPSIMTG